MHSKNLHLWQHSHTAGQDIRRPGERRTFIVIAITGILWIYIGVAFVARSSDADARSRPIIPDEMTDRDWSLYYSGDAYEHDQYPEIIAWFKGATDREVEDAMRKLFSKTSFVFVKYSAMRVMKERNISIRQYREFIVSELKKVADSKGPARYGDACGTAAKYAEILLPEDAGLILKLARMIPDGDYRNKGNTIQTIAKIGDDAALQGLKELCEYWRRDEPARLARRKERYVRAGQDPDTNRAEHEEGGHRIIANTEAAIAAMEARLHGGASAQPPAPPAGAAGSTNAPGPTSLSAVSVAGNDKVASPSPVPWILGGLLLLLSAAAAARVVARKKRA